MGSIACAAMSASTLSGPWMSSRPSMSARAARALLALEGHGAADRERGDVPVELRRGRHRLVDRQIGDHRRHLRRRRPRDLRGRGQPIAGEPAAELPPPPRRAGRRPRSTSSTKGPAPGSHRSAGAASAPCGGGSWPSRRASPAAASLPRRENVRSFACAAAAESTGFRPCRRSRPEASPGTPMDAWVQFRRLASLREACF